MGFAPETFRALLVRPGEGVIGSPARIIVVEALDAQAGFRRQNWTGPVPSSLKNPRTPQGCSSSLS